MWFLCTRRNYLGVYIKITSDKLIKSILNQVYSLFHFIFQLLKPSKTGHFTGEHPVRVMTGFNIF